MLKIKRRREIMTECETFGEDCCDSCRWPRKTKSIRHPIGYETNKTTFRRLFTLPTLITSLYTFIAIPLDLISKLSDEGRTVAIILTYLSSTP